MWGNKYLSVLLESLVGNKTQVKNLEMSNQYQLWEKLISNSHVSYI